MACKSCLLLRSNFQKVKNISWISYYAVAKQKTNQSNGHVEAKKNLTMCLAYSTAESYNLNELRRHIIENSSTPYLVGILPRDASDVLYVTTNSFSQQQNGHVFFFRRLGSFVCWNVCQEQISDVRSILKKHEIRSYCEDDVQDGFEQMVYNPTVSSQSTLIDGDILLNSRIDGQQQTLEKLAFSNAIALSVKLDAWEIGLERFSVSLRDIPELLKMNRKIRISRGEVLQKLGELLSLRHQMNLYSDLLTTPDFYWDRDGLERLYTKTCNYLEIAKRTKVLNAKMDLCSELVEMLRSHLNDRHSHRLEAMIIALIVIEVLFEALRLAT